MKTAGLFLFCSLTVFSACTFNGEGGKIFNIIPKEGKGPITEKEVKADFDEIKVAQSINAEIIKSDSEKVVISAPSDIIDDVVVETSGNRVYIHFKPGINISANKVKAKVYAKDFSRIEVSSSADVKVLDKFTQDKTTVKVSSSGSVYGDLEANDFGIDVSSSGSYCGKIWAVNLDAEVSSSGDVNISGKTKSAKMSASSSGSLDAKGVIADNADLRASSSGSVTLSVVDNLNASASSAGSIDVIKKGALANVSKNESSGGSVSIR